MALEKYVSEPREIACSDQVVFAVLSNLENLGIFVNGEKMRDLEKNNTNTQGFKIENFSATPDRCRFSISPVGQVGIEIVEREPFKTIKFQGEQGAPFPATFWIQLVPAGEDLCRMRLTLHAELNPMLKMMAGSYLSKGIDKLAETLAGLDYASLT